MNIDARIGLVSYAAGMYSSVVILLRELHYALLILSTILIGVGLYIFLLMDGEK